MKNISANFKLKKPNASSPTLIYLKAYFNKQRFTYSTGRKIHPQYWDEGTQRPITFYLEYLKKELKTNPGADLKPELKTVEELIKQGTRENPTFQTEMKNIATDLNRYEDQLITSYEYLLRQKEAVIPEKLKELMDRAFKQLKPLQTDKNAFYNRFDEFLEIKKQINSNLTVRKYNTLIARLQEFEKKMRYKITFESIDLVFYDKFSHFLVTYDNSRIEDFTGLLNDTVSKYISTLKAYMQWTFDRGYHQNITFQHKQFSAKKILKNEIVTLTESEFNVLYHHDLKNKPQLEKIRDVFCFALMTCQRWSDVEQFKKDDVKENTWEFISVKTKKTIRVPFEGFIKPAMDILKKYDYQLPLISSQKFNDYIKKVGQEVGLKEPIIIKRFSGKEIIEIKKPKYAFISSHMARRSGITILLQKGVPLTTVMKLSGHSDVRTLMKYENTSYDALVKALEIT